MLVTSASLPQDVATSSPDVATTTEASQRASRVREEMNQCIDRLQLDDKSKTGKDHNCSCDCEDECVCSCVTSGHQGGADLEVNMTDGTHETHDSSMIDMENCIKDEEVNSGMAQRKKRATGEVTVTIRLDSKGLTIRVTWKLN